MTDRFKGHELYKIGDGWVFDLTDCIGYRVHKSSATLIDSYKNCFSIGYRDETRTCNIEYKKNCTVPFGVVRKACNILLTKKGRLYRDNDTCR